MHELLVAAALTVAAVLPSPNPTLPTTHVIAPKAVLSLETATTPEEQERGLMSRTALAEHTGMIFVFDRDAQVSFWMKDTLVSLDMIFVASDGTVRHVFEHVAMLPPNIADARIPLESAQARYVIEIPAGEAARDGIAPGVRLLLHFPC